MKGRFDGFETSRLGAQKRASSSARSSADEIRFYACRATVRGRGGKDDIASYRTGEDGYLLDCDARKSQIRIYGDGGRDTIGGSRGKDLLVGGAGRDTINGNANRDTLQRREAEVLRDQASLTPAPTKEPRCAPVTCSPPASWPRWSSRPLLRRPRPRPARGGRRRSSARPVRSGQRHRGRRRRRHQRREPRVHQGRQRPRLRDRARAEPHGRGRGRRRRRRGRRDRGPRATYAVLGAGSDTYTGSVQDDDVHGGTYESSLYVDTEADTISTGTDGADHVASGSDPTAPNADVVVVPDHSEVAWTGPMAAGARLDGTDASTLTLRLTGRTRRDRRPSRGCWSRTAYARCRGPGSTSFVVTSAASGDGRSFAFTGSGRDEALVDGLRRPRRPPARLDGGRRRRPAPDLRRQHRHHCAPCTTAGPGERPRGRLGRRAPRPRPPLGSAADARGRSDRSRPADRVRGRRCVPGARLEGADGGAARVPRRAGRPCARAAARRPAGLRPGRGSPRRDVQRAAVPAVRRRGVDDVLRGTGRDLLVGGLGTSCSATATTPAAARRRRSQAGADGSCPSSCGARPAAACRRRTTARSRRGTRARGPRGRSASGSPSRRGCSAS